MRKVISASRRTDLVAFFSDWLSSAINAEKVLVLGPRRVSLVDLKPQSVHTFVLWSKNFTGFLENRHGLRDALHVYDQLYFLFTVTGLGGTRIEPEVPAPEQAISQLPALVEAAGRAERVSVRFDPVVYWKEGGQLKTNLMFFETLAGKLFPLGIKDVRFSFAQWYGKAVRRAAKNRFFFVDPSQEEKIEAARHLTQVAQHFNINLFSCSQRYLAAVPGVEISSCIDGRLLQALHPSREAVSFEKDRSQRKECGCTESVDIGSYTQSCPHSCLYCYANPKIN